MGYTTDFEGCFKLDKPLKPEHAEYLRAFAGTRRMQRNEFTVVKLKDTRRELVGLPVGAEGEFYVGSVDDGNYGQGAHFGAREPSIVNYNGPPRTQPGLWCQWVPSKDGTAIEWNGAEKFYNYIEWLEYLIANFLHPWGYRLNGEVEWRGEDPSDHGVIVVEDNEVSTDKFEEVRKRSKRKKPEKKK